MTPQIANILQLTQKMTVSEKQNLFWLMLQTFGQEKYFDYKTIDIPNGLLYILTYFENNSFDNETKNKRKFGIGKGIVSYMSSDFDEPLIDLTDKMF